MVYVCLCDYRCLAGLRSVPTKASRLCNLMFPRVELNGEQVAQSYCSIVCELRVTSFVGPPG